MSNYSNNNKQGIPWWLVIAAFIFMWPAGVVLLILKLSQENNGAKYRDSESYERFTQEARRGADEFRRVATDAAQSARRAAEWARDTAQTAREQAQQAQAEQRAKTTAQEAYRAAQSKYDAQRRDYAGKQAADKTMAEEAPKPKAKRKWGKLKDGFVFRLVGGIMMGVFAFAMVVTLAEGLPMITNLSWLVTQILPLFMFTGAGAGLFTYGQFKKSQSKRFKRYLNLIGDQDRVSITDLAAAFPARRRAVITALENMIEDGVLGDRAWIDFQNDELVLDGSGVGSRAKAAAEADAAEEHALLRQIRRINDAIADPEMSRKIDRIADITERILEFQQEHPERAGELRKFLNYYLPTTLKILSSYAQLEKQGVEGQNIAATKQRIEGMMDMVVEGFERQLDKLFAGDMMDIAADITVMEQMMQGDGLFGQDDIAGGAGMGGH